MCSCHSRVQLRLLLEWLAHGYGRLTALQLLRVEKLGKVGRARRILLCFSPHTHTYTRNGGAWGPHAWLHTHCMLPSMTFLSLAQCLHLMCGCGWMELHLVVPELGDFLMLYGRIVPDEVGRFILISGFVEGHLLDDSADCRKENKAITISLRIQFYAH